MATERWIGGSGVGFTWTSCFGASDLNSLANGSSVLASSSAITNQTALDIFCDISVSLGSVTTVAPNYLGVYIYPLNQDGSTYGDNQFTAGSGASATPGSSYYKGSIVIPVGTQALYGALTGIIMPPGTFLFLIRNQAGVTLASSGNTVKYRTYNRQVS
jgi:hypothetical protein